MKIFIAYNPDDPAVVSIEVDAWRVVPGLGLEMEAGDKKAFIPLRNLAGVTEEGFPLFQPVFPVWGTPPQEVADAPKEEETEKL